MSLEKEKNIKDENFAKILSAPIFKFFISVGVIVLFFVAINVFIGKSFWGLLWAILIAVSLNLSVFKLAESLAQIEGDGSERPPPKSGLSVDLGFLMQLLTGHISTAFIIASLSAMGLQFDLLDITWVFFGVSIKLFDLLTFLPLVSFVVLSYLAYFTVGLNIRIEGQKNLDCASIKSKLIAIQSFLPVLSLYIPLLIYSGALSSISSIMFVGATAIFGAGSMYLIIMNTLMCEFSDDDLWTLSTCTVLIHGFINPIIVFLLEIIESYVSIGNPGYLVGVILLFVAHLIDENLLVKSRVSEDKYRALFDENYHVVLFDVIFLYFVSKFVLHGLIGAIALFGIVFVIRQAKIINPFITKLSELLSKSEKKKSPEEEEILWVSERKIKLFLFRYLIPLFLIFLSLWVY